MHIFLDFDGRICICLFGKVVCPSKGEKTGKGAPVDHVDPHSNHASVCEERSNALFLFEKTEESMMKEVIV
jgi:hypothetical protein